MGDVVELRLDARQADSFREVIEQQKINGGFIFAFVSRSFEPSEGCATVKLQCKRCNRRIAEKVAKLLREDK